MTGAKDGIGLGVLSFGQELGGIQIIAQRAIDDDFTAQGGEFSGGGVTQATVIGIIALPQNRQALDARCLLDVADGRGGDAVVGVGQAEETAETVLGQAGAAAGRAEAGETGFIEKRCDGQAGVGAIGADDADGAVFLHQVRGGGRSGCIVTSRIVVVERDGKDGIADAEAGAFFVGQDDAVLAGHAEGRCTFVRGRHHADDDRLARRDGDFLGLGASRDPQQGEQPQQRQPAWFLHGVHPLASIIPQSIIPHP